VLSRRSEAVKEEEVAFAQVTQHCADPADAELFAENLNLVGKVR
jgi:hypothetical protein